ncbi:MAG: protein kinase [Pirellulaceae bacterium]
MMTATECPTADRLRAFSLGCLSEHESDDLLSHLQTCNNCKSELETIDDGEDSLISSLRTPDEFIDLEDEPDCQLALAKALGALAQATDSIAATDLQLPTTIGEYEIVRPIGRGGMGSVYLARHTKLRREVALKVVAGHRLADAKMKSRFDAEMQAVGRLSHPNIVTAHDAREVDGTAVLVTEYIDGFDLGQLVSRTGPLKIADACEIVAKVAAALQYTSDQGFVHRDIKPSNIMLSRSGEVKVLDLGLARLELSEDDSREITGTGQAIGTADYIAPEQVTDSRSVDLRADIYSLGCTFFKLLTGSAPFADAQHTTAFAKMTAHVSTSPPLVTDYRDDVPAPVQKMLASMLSKDASKRPQSPSQITQTLSRYSAGGNLIDLVKVATESSPGENAPLLSTTSAKTQPWFKRRVPITTAIAAGFFGGVVGLLLGLFIEITYSDGTKIKLPINGAKVTVVDDGQATEKSSKDLFQNPFSKPVDARQEKSLSKTKQASNDGEPFDKVMLAVCVKESEVLDVDDAKTQLRNGELHVHKQTLRWMQMAEGVKTPVTDFKDGLRYGLVKTNYESSLSWSQIQGHVLGVVNKQDGINLGFDDELGKAIHSLTKDNIQRELAIIVDGRIVIAPKIMSPLSNALVLTGKFSDDERLRLHDIFASAIKTSELTQRRGPKVSGHGPNDVQKSQNNLKQLGVAFYRFHDVFACFPGSANLKVGNKSDGIQPHSWRVAILPFVEEQALYQQYDYRQAWDSEHNLKLLEKMPAVFRSPRAGKDQPAGHTNYLGYATGDSALGKDGGIKVRDFSDGTANTLLLVETKDSVPWTKPQDLDGDAAFFSPMLYALADGSVVTTEALDPEELKKMITRDGGEQLKP